jgi:acetolactate synthase-1/2/3 large subunit
MNEISVDSLSAADVLARRLAEAGVRQAFGMPGGEVLTLVDALARAGIETVLARQETAAGFMAEGAWHATGAPGVLLATLGPGAMSAVNAVANAGQDRVPLIVLTGCVDEVEAATYTHQVLDHAQVFRAVAKASLRLVPGAAGPLADRAVSIALDGRPGPVHVDVPISAAAAPARPVATRPVPSRAVPDLAALTTARDWLDDARRPLILAGLDAVNEEAGPALHRLADTLSAPVVTTYKAKGLIPEDDPLVLGGAGLSPLADGHLLPLFAQADAILLAGYDPIEMRVGWREPWDPARTRVIELSAEPERSGMHGASLSMVASLPATLGRLGDGLAPREGWPGEEPQATRAALAAAFPTDEEWGPAAVIDECRRALPDRAVATVDSGAHRILLSQMWRTPMARGLLQSSGLCTMGSALPLALGRLAAEPGACVAAFMGDAGFLMVAGELSVAAERGLAPIVVVFVDASLALIEMKQRGRQLANAAVDFGHHDVAAIGRAFGGEGHRVTSREGLRAALEAGLEADRFTVIAAEIGRGAYDGRI